MNWVSDMRRLFDICKKHRDILVYLVFGVLTTLVNYLVYLPLYNLLNLSATASNIIAWFVAVLFAFLTNKPFVFKSRDWTLSVAWPEFCKFIGCRIGSGVAETLIIYITVDLFSLNGNLMKVITSILVVILNYISSRLLVFRKQ